MEDRWKVRSMQRLRCCLSAIVLTVVILTLWSTTAFAASVEVGKVLIEDTADHISNDNGTVIITTDTSWGIEKKNTITITNNAGYEATLRFSYSFNNNCRNYTINDIQPPNKSGTTNWFTLKDKDSVTIYISARGTNATAQVTISSIELIKVQASSQVTFAYDESLGSVSIDGKSVANGTTKTLSSSTPVTLKADTKNGSSFKGWVDGNNAILSLEDTFQYTAMADVTVKAVFTGQDGTAWFRVGTDRLFDDLNDAATYASTSANKVVIPIADGTLPEGNYVIPSGVTLLIPYDDADTLCTTKPTIVTTPYEVLGVQLGVNPERYLALKPYRTLTMASGAKITIKSGGAMSLSGKQCAAMDSNGCPYGPISYVCMNSGSLITVQSGGNLYAWGFITGPAVKNSSGAIIRYDADQDNCGRVVVESGGNVYEDFQVTDWRGGTAASSMLKNKQRVFPISQYYIQNVEVPLTLEAGAAEKSYFSMVAAHVLSGTNVTFIGDGGMFVLSSGGSLTKRYDGSADRLVVDIDGNMTISSLELALGSQYSIDSNSYVLPINSNISIRVQSGRVDVGQELALLPSAELYIGKGATLDIQSGKNVYVYDKEQWGGIATKVIRLPRFPMLPPDPRTGLLMNCRMRLLI